MVDRNQARMRRRAMERAASARLAAALDVDQATVRPLVRAGIREVADMTGWGFADLQVVPGVGVRRVAVLVPALRAAGIDLPGDPVWAPWHQRLGDDS